MGSLFFSKLLHRLPDWYKEGLAYFLSQSLRFVCRELQLSGELARKLCRVGKAEHDHIHFAPERAYLVKMQCVLPAELLHFLIDMGRLYGTLHIFRQFVEAGFYLFLETFVHGF